ncbi:transcriptional regulator, TetR family [Ruminococcaceae bacterium KH2T8]|nr:transcriptional regulator, TetR family [Ruminococcaceae bacterium KH2T8]
MAKQKQAEVKTPAPATKDRLVDAALELFSQKGYSATSVDEIAESIGIKGPNLYKYFKGKEALLDMLSDMSDEQYLMQMGMVKASPIKISNAVELKAYAIGQFQFTVSNEKVSKMRKMCTIEQYRSENFKKQTTYHQIDVLEHTFTAIFKDLIAEGKVKDVDPETLAFEFFSPVSLLVQWCDREPDRKDEIFKRVERHIDFFIDTYFIEK